MSVEPAKPTDLGDSEHLDVLGYEDSFNRSMTLWANFALGFTYLSPLVGVYSLFAVALTIGGPPSIWWIVIVGAGQLLVSLVFGEVVSQYPIHGGIYPWARRLWGRRYAWMAAWIYIWAMIVTITAVAGTAVGLRREPVRHSGDPGGHPRFSPCCCWSWRSCSTSPARRRSPASRRSASRPS